MTEEKIDLNAWGKIPACEKCNRFDCKCDGSSDFDNSQKEASEAAENIRRRELAKETKKDDIPWKSVPDEIAKDWKNVPDENYNEREVVGVKLQSTTGEQITEVTSLREPWKD